MNNSKSPKLIKTNMSNIDIFVLANELNGLLQDGFISNVYELPDTQSKTLILKLRSKSGKMVIIVDPKKRINITQFNYPVPPFPSQFITGLRKIIKGRRIEKIYQYNLDRIIVFELRSNEGNSWKLIIEFFAGGNYILVDGDGNTYMAQNYKKMRNREILAKKPYNFPTVSGNDIWTLTIDELRELLDKQEKEIVRILARSFNVGGLLAEEILLRAEVDKNKKPSELNSTEIEKIFSSMLEIVNILKNKKISPRIILDNNNNPIGFDSFEYKSHFEFKFEKAESLNQAVDVFFSKFDSEALFSGEHSQTKKKVSKQERILNKQLNTIEQSIENREKFLENGNLIYQYLFDIDQLISTIMTQKREKNLPWEQISETLLRGKEQGVSACLIYEKILPKEMKLLIDLQGNKYKLDLKLNARENAQKIYDKAKNAKRRIKGAKIAADITKEKLDLQREKQQQIEEQKAILLRKPKMKWYEKYRWFISTDDFIIIGGRDASSNETIVNKHMNNNDLFFHADVRGAAVCLIKNDNKLEIPQSTIQQAAIFASCYSSAWKKGWGNTKIFYVEPNQVSKTPQSGEYLKKGSFVITGTKNYIPKPRLNLAIGIQLIPIYNQITNEMGYKEEQKNQNLKDWKQFTQEMNEDGEQVSYYPKLIAAPIKAILRFTLNFVVVKPMKNGLKASSLAKQILHEFKSQANRAATRWINLASLDDLIRILPAGNANIAK